MKKSNSGKNWNYYDSKDMPTKNDGYKSMEKTEKVEKLIKARMKFYGRHIENLKCVEPGTSNCSLIGDSPFGDASIIITKKGTWYCYATNCGGDRVEFLQKLHPLLSEQGANRASIEETVNVPDFDGLVILDEENIRQHVQLFHEELQLCEVIDDAEKAVLYNNHIWTKEPFTFQYVEMSRTNKPLCHYRWTGLGFYEDTTFLRCGVPRIQEHPEADRIYFVEDPLHLIFLKETINDPIYVKPDSEMYSLNDYLKLVDGKDIVYCKTQNPIITAMEDWEYTLIKRSDRLGVQSFFPEII